MVEGLFFRLFLQSNCTRSSTGYLPAAGREYRIIEEEKS
jgi:hypothetical protein